MLTQPSPSLPTPTHSDPFPTPRVLQKGVVEFDPPLPPYKQAAIRALGMGTENRVAMVFPSVFWPEVRTPYAARRRNMEESQIVDLS